MYNRTNLCEQNASKISGPMEEVKVETQVNLIVERPKEQVESNGQNVVRVTGQEPALENQTTADHPQRQYGTRHGPQNHQCDICHVQERKYNFKCCQWKFCSLECYRKHTQEISDETQQTSCHTTRGPESSNANECVDLKPNGEDQQQKQMQGIPEHLKADCGGPRRLTNEEIANARMERRSWRTATADSDEDDELLTEDQKKNLETNPKLQKWFSLFEIRRAVRDIDKSKHRIDRLAHNLSNEKFAQFIHDLIDVLEGHNQTDAVSDELNQFLST